MVTFSSTSLILYRFIRHTVYPGYCKSSQAASVPGAALKFSPWLQEVCRVQKGCRDAVERGLCYWESASPFTNAHTDTQPLAFTHQVCTLCLIWGGGVFPIWDWFLEVCWFFLHGIVSCCWPAVSLFLLSFLASHCLSSLHRTLQKSNESSFKQSREGAADVATLLQHTQSALEQLQSEVWCVCVCVCMMPAAWLTHRANIFGSTQSVYCVPLLLPFDCSASSWTMRHRVWPFSLQAHCVWPQATSSSSWRRSATFLKQTWERTAAENPRTSAQRPTSSREYTSYCRLSSWYAYMFWNRALFTNVCRIKSYWHKLFLPPALFLRNWKCWRNYHKLLCPWMRT